MAYLWSLVAVGVGVILLVVLALVLLGPVRRMSVVSAALAEEVDRKGGMLKARAAALRVRFAERRA